MPDTRAANGHENRTRSPSDVTPLPPAGGSEDAAARLRASGVGWVLAVAAVCLAIQSLLSRYLFWDSYFGLVAGRYIASEGIPRMEVLTTEAKPLWIDQQWLAHWLFYEAWSVGGFAAAGFLSAASVTLGFTLLAALMVQRGIPGPRAFIWSLAALGVALGGTVVRAQSLSLPLAVLLLWAVVADSRRPGFRPGILLVLPVLVVWANVHGSVLLGAGIFAVYAAVRSAAGAARADWRSATAYAATALLALGSVFVTPYGLDVLDYYRSLLDNQTVHLFILEWAPPALDNPYSLGFLALLVVSGAVLVYGLASGYRPPAVLMVGAAGLAALAFTGVRFQVWFGIVGALLLADVLAHTRRPPPPFPRPVLAAGAIVLTAAALVGTIVLAMTSDDEFERDLPTAAMSATAAFAESHPGARVLADEIGSALLWRHPGLAGRVAFDARLEQYPEQALRTWFEYLSGISPGWPELAYRYDVLLASGVERPELVQRLGALQDWTELHSEPNGAAFVRQAP